MRRTPAPVEPFDKRGTGRQARDDAPSDAIPARQDWLTRAGFRLERNAALAGAGAVVLGTLLAVLAGGGTAAVSALAGGAGAVIVLGATHGAVVLMGRSDPRSVRVLAVVALFAAFALLGAGLRWVSGRPDLSLPWCSGVAAAAIAVWLAAMIVTFTRLRIPVYDTPVAAHPDDTSPEDRRG